MKSKLTIILVAIYILSGCTSEINVVDIAATNKEIKNSTEIDLQAFKNKVDKEFPDKDFYIKLCSEISIDGQNGDILERFGPITHYDNGNPIEDSDRDSLFKIVTHAIGRNINLDGCDDSDLENQKCQFKNQWFRNLISIDKVYTMSPSVYFEFNKNYADGYTNYSEFSYLCIALHFLFSILYLK